MFDKSFFKFALGFTAIIALSVGALYFTGQISQGGGEAQTATVR